MAGRFTLSLSSSIGNLVLKPRLTTRCLLRNITTTVLVEQNATAQSIGLTDHGQKLMDKSTPISDRLQFIEPSLLPVVPAFRLLNPDGTLLGELDAKLTEDKIISLYCDMLFINVMDKIMYDSQRQGRISFYMTNFGEEATQLGSAAALSPDDWVFAQYREAGVLIHRQMPLRQMLAQCYGSKEDLGKGRQMPIHYGNRRLNFVTISSTLTTQLPQAAGVAYSFKLDPKQSDKIVMCYFGEGAASEGDAHAAMNFASTLSCPVIFFCRNNGYAISTPTNEQFAGDGIVNRGLGYGMTSLRVDGNDLFAVFEATKQARLLCQREKRPVLIEAMTYRVGHHSTSDDSSAYRDVDEVKQWDQKDSPIKRVYNYLMTNGLWSDERERQYRHEARDKVIEALTYAEKVKKLPIDSMFDDVYDVLPDNLQRQRKELHEHLQKYGQYYPIDEYETN